MGTLRQEVKRLEQEVDRWRHREAAAMYIAKMNGSMLDDARAQRTTAHDTALTQAADLDLILTAISDVHDMDVTLEDYARSVSKAILALKRGA